jgi:hypothetical protein
MGRESTFIECNDYYTWQQIGKWRDSGLINVKEAVKGNKPIGY